MSYNQFQVDAINGNSAKTAALARRVDALEAIIRVLVREIDNPEIRKALLRELKR